MATTIDGDERLMATAQHIVKSLNTSKDVTDDMILIFSSFDNRLSNITSLIDGGGGGGGGGGGDNTKSTVTNSRLDSAEKIILRFDSSSGASSIPWEDSPDETSEYLAAIDEIIQLTEGLTLSPEFVDRAESALQLAMNRLEDEFRSILIRNTVPLDSNRLYGSIRRISLSFVSQDGEEIEDFGSFGEEESGKLIHERGVSLGDDLWVELVRSEAVNELREIADRMIRSGYEKECCQVYSSVRRDALDESLVIIGIEKLSIEEVQKIEWKSLDEKMKKWVQCVKIVIRVLLTGEKRICEEVFDDAELIKDICFIETAKGCVMQLLNFAEAIAIARRSSEKLFRILDMYDALKYVMPDLEALFPDDSGEYIRSEAHGVLAALGEAAKGTFVEFENAVKGESSRKAIQGAEIHPLTRYVMNYVRLLVDYSQTLNALLESDESESDNLQSSESDSLQLGSMTPLALRLHLLLSSLQSNLEEKSRLYEDGAMQNIFLMNNILYIVQKVKDSELGKLLGDDWVRKRRGQIRQYSTLYLRASWSKALSCLKDDGIGGSSSNASKVALKERFKNFNACFEEIYRVQTSWKVPDPQLREELRISISEKVIPAYRSFMGRFGSQLEGGRHSGKYIKYTPEDLECYLLDLFEGSPNVLHHMRRKSS
ncbi:Exocyst complex subunit Exo70, C-terminal [Dillenia turbinata]|uniref:Exocyst subunit Exo70 family protein n=1 Tax=Dillenia turbinata TaxID=194707 RepID=A0AAN8V8F4_9MAGN